MIIQRINGTIRVMQALWCANTSVRLLYIVIDSSQP